MSDNTNVLSSAKKVKEEYRQMMYLTIDKVLSSIKDESAFSGIDPLTLRKEVTALEVLPEKGTGFGNTLGDIERVILPNLLRTWSTQYMPHLHSPALLESIASEVIISTFNDSMDSWDQSPAATELEVHVINTLCKLFGYDAKADGTFTSGGSQSNFSAITAARDWYCSKHLNWDVKKKGLPLSYNKLRLYTSAISHFSMDKSAHVLGLGYDAVRHLSVNDKMQVDVKAFREMVKKDVEDGLIPFCAVATIGTTDFGSIDNIEEMRKVCDEYGMHLHADAAYGSGAILSKYRSRLGHMELADSITIDFHKMFLLPISCSAVLVKDAALLDCFELHADYLNREEDEEEGYINLVSKGMQTTRRFDALKVYTSFSTRGKDGFDRIISTAIENAMYFYDSIKQDELFITCSEPELSSVVFALKGGDEINKKIRKTLLKEGIVIGQTVKDGIVMLKFTLLNPALTHSEIDALIIRIKEIRKEAELS